MTDADLEADKRAQPITVTNDDDDDDDDDDEYREEPAHDELCAAGASRSTELVKSQTRRKMNLVNLVNLVNRTTTASYPRGSRLQQRVPRVDRHVVRHVQPRDASKCRTPRPSRRA